MSSASNASSKSNVNNTDKPKPKKRRRREIPKSRSLLVRAANSIETAVGGRQALIDTVNEADLSPGQMRLFAIIADPRNDARPLAKICAETGYTLGHVLQLFKDAKLAKAQIAAITRVTDAIPQVAEDLMKLAVIRHGPCNVCEGQGRIYVTDTEDMEDAGRKGKLDKKLPTRWIPCVICRGTGLQEIIPDLRRQEIALELAGIYKRTGGGGGVQVGVQVNTPGSETKPASDEDRGVTPKDLSRIRMGTDRLLYPGRTDGGDTSEVIDADVVVAAVHEALKTEDLAPTVDLRRALADSIKIVVEGKRKEQEPRRVGPITLDPVDPVDPDRSDRSDRSLAGGLNGRPFLPPPGRRS